MSAQATSIDSHAKIVNLLQNTYQDCTSGFGADRTDEDVDVMNLQYGEVTYAGMEPLFTALKLQPDDVFYDLGCGTGKLVLYVALRRQAAAQKGRCVGLEVGERRLQTAKMVCDRIETKLGHSPDVSMQLQDISRVRYSDASVVVLTNLCMDAGIVNRTVDNLLRCPSFKRIVCITPLVSPRLKLVSSVQVSCTWCKMSSWHVYDVISAEQFAIMRRPPAPAPCIRVRSKPALPRTASMGGSRRVKPIAPGAANPFAIRDAASSGCNLSLPALSFVEGSSVTPIKVL